VGATGQVVAPGAIDQAAAEAALLGAIDQAAAELLGAVDQAVPATGRAAGATDPRPAAGAARAMQWVILAPEE
jgi:hypothetical protein